MNSARPLLVFALLGTSALVACGGGGSSLGLPRDSQLNTLTAADLKTACLGSLDLFQFPDEVLRGQCATSLLPKGEAACTAGVDSCVASQKAILAKQADPTKCNDQVGATNAFMSCSGTVGDLEDCLNGIGSYAQTTFGGVTCATTNPPTSSFEPFKISACAAINAKCPSLFSSTTAMQGM